MIPVAVFESTEPVIEFAMLVASVMNALPNHPIAIASSRSLLNKLALSTTKSPSALPMLRACTPYNITANAPVTPNSTMNEERSVRIPDFIIS